MFLSLESIFLGMKFSALYEDGFAYCTHCYSKIILGEMDVNSAYS